MTPYAELVKVFKLARAEGEDFDGYARRAVKKINACSEEQWKDLSTELQVWNNTTQEALEKQESLPLLEGWPEEEPVELERDVEEPAPDGDDGDEAPEEAEPEPEEEGEPEEAEPEPEEVEPAVAAKSVKRAVVKKVTKPTKEKEKVVAKKKVVKAATPKAAKANGNGAAKAGRASKFSDDAKIKILAKEPPHRKGTKNAQVFAKYVEGMTVAAALKKGIPLSNIRYEAGLNNIKVA